MSEEIDEVVSSGVAVLHIDGTHGNVLACNAQACDLLAREEEALVGSDWRLALGLSEPAADALARALSGRGRVVLPPLLLQAGAAGEIAADGYVIPNPGRSHDAIDLLLFPLAQKADLPFADSLAGSDVVAVLGVDTSAHLGVWSADENARMMMDVYTSLQQIVPAAEDVALPRGCGILLVLRQVGIEQAEDISRALISHLAPVLPEQVRTRIGLATVEKDGGGLAAIIAANAALLCCRQRESETAIAVASEHDQIQLFATASFGEGLFGGDIVPRTQMDFLTSLTRLEADPRKPLDYLFGVCALILRQQLVSAAAVYRRNPNETFSYVAGGLAADASQLQKDEKGLPKELRRYKPRAGELAEQNVIYPRSKLNAVFPLRSGDGVLGYLVLQYADAGSKEVERFEPGVAAMHRMSTVLSAQADWREVSGRAPAPRVASPPRQEELEGYVADNMEGAIDQAVFLARVDIPVAVIGPRGTGKLYVARTIHQEWGGAADAFIAIDCREFRSRKDALSRLARELEHAAGKTLVFKSPHLMNGDAQLKLARQIGSRILADTQPPRYIADARFVALFPDSIDHLVRLGGLNEKLASVFSGYPILVPPIRDRKRAVLRWAHKILAQEAARRDRRIAGFTPDAEQAMLQHDWPGNISEMRQCVSDALDKTDKPWLTPVDIGLFKGLTAGAREQPAAKRAFLQSVLEPPEETVEQQQGYSASALDDLGVALGVALHSLLETQSVKPLGSWLDDEAVLAACERFRGNLRGAADLLHTRSRNISRWMPAILARDHERGSSLLWQEPRRLVKVWMMESPLLDDPPLQVLQGMLLSHVERQCAGLGVAERARIMGLSAPTYQKRLQDFLNRDAMDG